MVRLCCLHPTPITHLSVLNSSRARCNMNFASPLRVGRSDSRSRSPLLSNRFLSPLAVQGVSPPLYGLVTPVRARLHASSPCLITFSPPADVLENLVGSVGQSRQSSVIRRRSSSAPPSSRAVSPGDISSQVGSPSQVVVIVSPVPSQAAAILSPLAIGSDVSDGPPYTASGSTLPC